MPVAKYASVRCPVCNTKQTPSTTVSSNDVLVANCVACSHPFKFRANPPYKTAITFTVDDIQYSVGNEYAPSTVLNGWLRENRVSVGTKHMCYQGGCGSCLVETMIMDPKTQTKLSYAVNSCLLPLYACDGMEFRTVDHIGSIRDGLHPIQKQIANYNGSQCGYCTPGQVMNMFALTERYGTGLTKKQVEDSFDGNICRCTGYRPILKAFKDMATPVESTCHGYTVDIEDIFRKTCNRSGEQCHGTCSGDRDTTTSLSTWLAFATTQWYRPTTQKEVIDILQQSAGKSIRFVFGNTSTGVYRDLSPGNFDVVIDPTALALLYTIDVDATVVLGSGLTLTNLHDVFSAGQQQSNFGECANLLLRVANLPVRNRATWTGNICMKHAYNDFQSDVFVLMQVLNVLILTGFMGDSIPITDFLTTDLTGKIIVGLSFASLAHDEYIKFYKVAQRAQNSHCYVTGGFRAKVDRTTGIVVNVPIVIAYAGLGAKFNRATKTEQYIAGKQLTDPTVLQTALSTLQSEILVDVSPALSSATYRTNLALSLFYKYVLYLVGDLAAAPYRSGSSDLFFDRPISSGIQTYDTVPVEYPVTQPLKKVEADAQATGEAEYIDDMGAFARQLEAAFVLSTVGNAKLGTIDATVALKMPGVVKVITAKDIHDPETNNISPPSQMAEEVLASTDISYNGQPVALVLAESYSTALDAASAVKVTYTDVQAPIVDITDGIKQQSFFPDMCKDKEVGDPDGAIAGSAKKITGSIAMGQQYHFYLETQISVCVPTEDGLDVYTSTQFLTRTQDTLAQVTGLPKNSIRMRIKRLGGAFGGKISRNNGVAAACCLAANIVNSISMRIKRLGGAFGGKIFLNNGVAAACCLAANIVNRPVKLRLTLGDNMKMLGKRVPYLANYEVGFTDDGLLNGIKLTYYADCGINPNGCSLPALQGRSDNAYLCQNWKISGVAVKTNTPANTAARAPANLPANFTIESIMEHVAKSLGKDPTQIRILNTYSLGATNPLNGMVLVDCNLKQNIAALQASAQFAQRQHQIGEFNGNNRWKKRGLSLVPLKYGIPGKGVHFGCQLSVFNVDGTLAISHGGIEIGQGINTKVAQACAYELGIPMTLIKVSATTSLIGANSTLTSGSMASENCCQAVIQCCKTLNDRIDPVRQKMTDKSWKAVINKCSAEGIDLCVRSWSENQCTTSPFYNSYGATIAEVEFDVLTGEHQITRVDIQFDCGQSINPALDVGQVEGAFVMGLGYWLTEQCRFDHQTGALLTDSTWEYKPPSSKDIPVDFRVNFLKKSPSKVGILGSKASGEPPICMSSSTLYAIKRAIEAARKDIGQDVFFPLNGPATSEICQLMCLTNPKNFVLQ